MDFVRSSHACDIHFAGGDYDGDKAHLFWDPDLVGQVDLGVEEAETPSFPPDLPREERKDTRVVVGKGADGEEVNEQARLRLLIESFVQRLGQQPMIGKLATALDQVGT